MSLSAFTTDVEFDRKFEISKTTPFLIELQFRGFKFFRIDNCSHDKLISFQKRTMEFPLHGDIALLEIKEEENTTANNIM